MKDWKGGEGGEGGTRGGSGRKADHGTRAHGSNDARSLLRAPDTSLCLFHTLSCSNVPVFKRRRETEEEEDHPTGGAVRREETWKGHGEEGRAGRDVLSPAVSDLVGPGKRLFVPFRRRKG